MASGSSGFSARCRSTAAMASMRRPGMGQLRLADALAQLGVQQQRQLPGRQQHGEAVRVVGAVVRRVEQPLQQPAGAVEVACRASAATACQ